MIHISSRQDVQASLQKFSEYFIYLPKTEQDLISYVLQDMPQKEIARILGVTQGAVSSRQKRALQRLTFLKELKKTSFSGFEYEFNTEFDSFEMALMKSMSETTCQSETARILNDRYNLSGNKKMTQVKVKYRFEKCLIKIKDLCDKADQADPATLKKYIRFYKFLILIKTNLYKLHEVKLPHYAVEKGVKNA